MTLSGISYSGQVKFLQVQITFRDFLLRTSWIFTSSDYFPGFLTADKLNFYKFKSFSGFSYSGQNLPYILYIYNANQYMHHSRPNAHFRRSSDLFQVSCGCYILGRLWDEFPKKKLSSHRLSFYIKLLY